MKPNLEPTAQDSAELGQSHPRIPDNPDRIFLNDFHREWALSTIAAVNAQPPTSTKDALAQYERLKRESEERARKGLR
jgi:hypothetical protein